jgi:glycosyltransferase involved in cell wall biosynthesis
MKKPSLSVVLPVYNGERFLRSAIYSVLNQRFDHDFELVLVDDGSSDRTYEISKQFATHDSRVHIISRENKGLVVSLNEGIQASRGKWIARMDADDVCLPDRFTRQLAWANAHHADVCGGFVKTFGHVIPRTRRYPVSNSAIRLKLLFNSCFAHPTVMARRDVLLNFPYDNSFRPADDYELWTRLAAAGFSLTNLPAVVLKYRIHKHQMTAVRRPFFDLMSAKIAEVYRLNCFPKFSNKALALFHSRGLLLDDLSVASCIENLYDLLSCTGQLEHVITDNAFNFLARHGEISPATMLRLASAMSLSTPRTMLLFFLALINADQQSLPFHLLYNLR